MRIKSLTFVVMKFNRVLHATVSHRPKPRNRRNSTHLTNHDSLPRIA